MESDERESMTWAKGRIKELEDMVAALTEKVKVAETKNLMLVKLLGNLGEKSKFFSSGQNGRDVVSCNDGKAFFQESCQQDPSSCVMTPDNAGTGFETETSIKDEEVYVVGKIPPFEESAIVQGRLDRANKATCDAKISTTVGMHLDPVVAERGATWSQAEKKVKKGKHGRVHPAAAMIVMHVEMGATGRSLQNQATRHVALKIMYLGSSYHGFASQGASHKTVESVLFAALEHTKLLIGNRAEVNYSRCGRTDKGVSAIGQLIALQLRSRIKTLGQESGGKIISHGEEGHVLLKNDLDVMDIRGSSWDRVAAARASRNLEESVSSVTGDEDEIDYIGALNRVLPEDIRVLGWCPVPGDFNARFSCLYREYKYFFINGNLDIDAMKLACAKFLGDHDFRNFCKMDATNVHNYRRTISTFKILPVNESWAGRQVWMMRIRGTAFLWHQIRCMAAVLFMVGEGHESPKIVEDLLDVQKVSRKPQYIMASELPLVLHTCGFQGLTLHCPPRAARHLHMHLNNIMEQTLVQLALLQEAMSELPSPSMSGMEERSTRTKQHTPLLLRLTEPSYEERRGGKM